MFLWRVWVKRVQCLQLIIIRQGSTVFHWNDHWEDYSLNLSLRLNFRHLICEFLHQQGELGHSERRPAFQDLEGECWLAPLQYLILVPCGAGTPEAYEEVPKSDVETAN